MRESQTKKIPYTLVIGDKECDNNEISYRKHGEEKTTTVTKEEFINMLKDEIINKKRKKVTNVSWQLFYLQIF